MVVGGTSAAPTLGILDRAHAGVDLRDCGLHSPRPHGRPVGRRRLHHEGRPGAVRRLDAQRRAQARAPDRVARRRADAAAGGALDGRRVADPQAPAVAARRAPDPARRLAQRPAVARGDPRGRARDRADRPGGAAHAGGRSRRSRCDRRAFFQTNTLVAASLYDQARDVGRRDRPGDGLGPLLRRRRLRPARVRRPAGRSPASRCPPRRSRPRRPRLPRASTSSPATQRPGRSRSPRRPDLVDREPAATRHRPGPRGLARDLRASSTSSTRRATPSRWPRPRADAVAAPASRRACSTCSRTRPTTR